jgi:LytS/YehU family sensor histidine kinase
MEQIPSLMLQPIVENALKHGLGPKPGPGHLWITAEADGNQVRLRVEDDGIGTAIGVLKLNGSIWTIEQSRARECCAAPQCEVRGLDVE